MAMIRPEIDMKDSGIEWVGVIPKEWSSIKGKYVYFVQAGYPFNSEHFSLIKGMPLIRIRDITSGKCETYFDGDYSDEYVVNNTDLLIGMDGDFNVRWWESGQAVLNQRCCRILEKNNISRKYLYYALPFSLKELNDLTYFTTVKHLSNNGILNLNFPFPPLSEQQAIADYLDETCSKIDEIIAEAKASIDEYKELKQSVIFEAVTKGLDKNVNVYKTGNSWIPSLPVGIKLSRFGLHHDIILGKMLCPNPRNEEDTLEPYYCAANVHFDGVTGVLKTMWFNSKEKETYVVHKNDMLIVEGGAGAGGAAIMNEEPPVSTFVQNSIMIVRSHMKDNRYSCYLVQALVKNKYVDVVCNKATIPHFTKEKVSYMPYPVFNRNERNEIANYLDERCKQIDSLIAEKEYLINDLEAYKKSLIYEVVTGKRRVV